MFIRAVLIFILMTLAPIASAQGASLAFGPLAQDTSAPVEIEADELTISQADNSATFTGNVIISQGEMRLSAPLVTVIYNDETSDIDALMASGGVILVSGEEAAEADSAEYSVTDGIITMRGNVLLARGLNTLASEVMVVNLAEGTAVLSGRVRTILQPKSDQ